ncbi:MAG TPA: cytochrome c [Deltaproteobacteria bacterium]|nr:cytochrome c [Deltaproteobacteria bacterium]
MRVAEAFVGSRRFREAALQASLVDPVRGYGQDRLDHYTQSWDRLEVYNPASLPEELPDDVDTLIALGREAFLSHPLAPSQRWQPILDGELGSGVDPTTLVELEVGDKVLPAQTCATCHSAGAVLGLGNPELALSPDGSWPRGTVDPTPDDRDNPTVVPDLRPIRHQAALHAAGTLHNSLAGLSVRIDTLLITSAEEAHRPPRIVPVAIAAWLWSLGDTLTEPDLSLPGASIFEEACAACHALDGVAAPIAVELVGTDPEATRSQTRGTGRYRIPSLRGVSDRPLLLHDASVGDLRVLLDPARVQGGPTPGPHPFGLELSPGERDALLRFLWTL